MPIRDRTRTRVATGIYADAIGLAATVHVGQVQREKRFPADTPLDTIRSWRAQTLSNLLEDHQAQTKQRDDRRSLARSIVAYLKRRSGRPSVKADRSHLKAWLPFIGKKRRHQVTRDDVEKALQGQQHT